jgi:hypothetical protein
MKTIISVSLIFLTLTMSGCATLFGETGLTQEQIDCQHHKPGIGEPEREIRAGGLICDIVFGLVVFSPITVGIDFLTGDIYKPCKIDIKYNCTIQKDTLAAQAITNMMYEDNNLSILFNVTSTSIDFTITNKAKQSLKVDWNDVTIIQNGATCRAVHNGVKLLNRNESQPPSTIPSNATMDDGVTPSDNINWNEPSTYYAGGWQTRPLSMAGGIRLYLPIQYQGKTIEYNVTFTKTVNTIKPQ